MIAKTKLAAMALASLALLATSCSSEDALNFFGAKDKMTFKATQETPGVTSRTTLASDGLTINWQTYDEETCEGDQVDVFDDMDASSCTYSVTVDENDPTMANLEGDSNEGSTKFLAIYPDATTNSAEYDGTNGFTNISITIPSTQSPSEGTFDPKAAFMVATASTDDPVFKFKNACAFLKLTTTKDYSEITISADNDYLCGTFKVGLADDGPTLTYDALAEDGAKEITFSSSSINISTIPAGTYYFCVPPTTSKEGSTFTIVCDEDTYTSAPTKLERNKVYDLGNLGYGVTIENCATYEKNSETIYALNAAGYNYNVAKLTFANVKNGETEFTTSEKADTYVEFYSDEACTSENQITDNKVPANGIIYVKAIQGKQYAIQISVGGATASLDVVKHTIELYQDASCNTQVTDKTLDTGTTYYVKLIINDKVVETGRTISTGINGDITTSTTYPNYSGTWTPSKAGTNDIEVEYNGIRFKIDEFYSRNAVR